MKKVLGHTVWIAALALVGVVTAGFQADYLSRYRFGLADDIPDAFRYMSLEVSGYQAMQDQGAAAAMPIARELVRRRPVPSESLSLLGVAASARQDEALASEALVMAAGRGWRDRVAQLSMVMFAQSAEAHQVAAERVAALWGAGDASDAVYAATQAVLAEDGSREALAAILGSNPLWRGDFVNWAAGAVEPSLYLDLLHRARAHGARFDCRNIQGAAVRLLRGGSAEAAEKLWYGSCGADGESTSFAFSRPVGAAKRESPFGWSYPSDGGIDRQFVDEGRSVAIRYENGENMSLPLASRFSALKPGPHDVSARFTGEAPAIRIACNNPGNGAGLIIRLQLSESPARFVIPAGTCPAQAVDILVPSGSGTVSSIVVE
ncbi:hypothetical protein ACLIMP_05690 [Novosphingobium aerophilum]|uniref:hypothetical protein n=1 Tax=Novosphingobium TaxID=165696 RepID=UPI002D768CF6|nr:hypothetical protein [Novosphingobium sp. RL4]WRT93729.1 hypothetical protein U9J33_04235 [Novosphingobium sp. RL4]